MEKVLKSITKYRCQIIACFILVGHFLFLVYFFEPAFSTPDANGYFKQAQLIVDHGRTWLEEESPIQYIGIHWIEAEGNRFFSRYPPGLPIIVALIFKLFGPDAGVLVSYILTTLTLLGLFVLCSMWIGKGWALVAIAAMACNPITNSHAVIGVSHTATALFLIWGIVFLARWSKNMSLGSAFLAGLFLGYIPTIRYSEVLFGLGTALFILFHLKNNKKAWSSSAVAIIGAMIPILCLMGHNQLAFGAVWKTAYSLTKEQTGFSVNFFSQNIVPYLKNILVYGAGLLWIFGLAGLSILSIKRETRKQGILFIVLIFPITLLYIAYYFMLDDYPFATVRYLLPTFYIYTIAGIWGLKIISDRWKKTATVMTLTLIVVNTLWGVPQSLVSMIIVKDANASLASVEKVVSENVNPGSIVIAPSHIQQHLDYLGQWRLIDDCFVEGLPNTLRYIISAVRVVEGRIDWTHSIYNNNRVIRSLMATSHYIERKIKTLPYMAAYRGDEASEEFLNKMDRWSKTDREIYWIGKVKNMKDRVPPNDKLSVIKKIEPPQLLFLKFKTMLPNHVKQVNQLKDRFWNGLFLLDEFAVNPLGVIQLIQEDGGLELVKWTRVNDS